MIAPMSLSAEDKVFVLQRFVNNFAADLLAVHAAFADHTTPEPAQRILIGALNYALDKYDVLPDHRGGIGYADDAIVLRIAAKMARAEGAKHPSLEPLALDANNVINVFADLAERLEKYVMLLTKREVRGRNADKILSHNLTRASFDSDINSEAKKYTPQKIGTTADAPKAVDELYRALRDTLIRAKLK
jgi:uncharacterized membrane protein YkvA (DUF1232 family)